MVIRVLHLLSASKNNSTVGKKVLGDLTLKRIPVWIKTYIHKICTCVWYRLCFFGKNNKFIKMHSLRQAIFMFLLVTFFVLIFAHFVQYFGRREESKHQTLKFDIPSFSGQKVRLVDEVKFAQDSKLGIVNLDKDISCENWAVVTTIYKASDSVRHVARDPVWCLVIVGDKNAPSKADYMADIGAVTGKTVLFLSPADQERIFPLLSRVIPWNDMSRKNIGYMYAIKHGAKLIWDFDDDNMNLLPGNIMDTLSKYRAPCSTFLFHIFNPYYYFAVNETYTWPRGQPLEHIRNPATKPKLCFFTFERRIGVIQSLANIEPDVDAIYRFTRNTPFNFGATPSSHTPVVVPPNAYSPFNAQATLWTKDAFLYLPLPMSVTYRVADIWRSYIAQYFFHQQSLSLVFVPPYIDQHRNVHDYLKDFNDEIDLYQKSDKLLAWMSKDIQTDSLLVLYKEMYERGYLEEKDLPFISAWIKTFEEVSQK